MRVNLTIAFLEFHHPGIYAYLGFRLQDRSKLRYRRSTILYGIQTMFQFGLHNLQLLPVAKASGTLLRGCLTTSPRQTSLIRRSI
jgi:hypothetical protein